MNWIKAVIAGVVGGVALNIAEFVMHGIIMSKTYARYPIFTQEQANPLWFLVIAVCMGLAAALLWARTCKCWPDGVKGGATYGFFLGLVLFFPGFYNTLIYVDFPYYLSWCWGSINVIGMVILGSVISLVYKKG